MTNSTCNLSRISHRFRDMVGFSLNFLPPPLNPQLENVSLALNRQNFAFLSLKHMANYSSEKCFPTT